MSKQLRAPWRRALCGALALCMAAACGGAAVNADYKSDWEKAEQELKKEEQVLQQIKNEKNKAEQQKKSLENQQTIIISQINDTIDQINQKNSEIAIQQQAIADQQAVIDERWADFKERMQAMQVMQDTGAVAVLASAQSLYDLLTYSDNLQRISEKDTEILQEMNDEKARLEEEEAALEAAKADLEDAKAALDSKENQLAANIQAQNKTISDKEAAAQAQETVVAEMQKKADEAEKQYEAWVASQASTGSGVCAEGFRWPLDIAGRVTTEFGATQNINGVIQTGHSGMDIAAPYGTPIKAAHDGVISSTTGHWSYGNVVMVDNGDGVTTLYAHMSSIAVGVGQSVKQGDVIGYVGSTGNSTGNHLHFEVRINGVKQNPRNYVAF
ncbi:M23 family metallopeptidase [Gemmiger sp. An194]|uniref:murein hydrolase activator EnvC family protein n=1 Tax=Gemmiger sp. An194 TaxID=1965582 RepID=UPI000B3767E0|nr:M23 family metallopeptidase [Gemmiger sp. An194]OUP25264.1 hypothetical protein B5F28_02995 [Gemmiger sp. An194]